MAGWLGWAALPGVAIYGMFTDFSQSTAGSVYGTGVATISCVVVTSWLMHAGFFRKLHETASSRLSVIAGSAIVTIVFWACSWLVLARAVPAAATWRYGEEQWLEASIARHEFVPRSGAPRYSALVELPGHDTLARLRIEKSEYRQLRDMSHGQVLVRQSWFGAHVLEVHLESGAGAR